MAVNREFDEERTIEVWGVSEFLRDEFTKHFQSDKAISHTGDVDRVYVCPDNKNLVLVEFSEAPRGSAIDPGGVEVKINGCPLRVMPYSSSTNASDEHGGVSQIWDTNETPIYSEEESDHSLASGERETHGKQKSNRDQKQTSARQQRQNKIEERRHRTSKQIAASFKGKPMFGEAQVKLNPDLLEKLVSAKADTQKMLQSENVHLNEEEGYLSGLWDALSNVLEKLHSRFGEYRTATESSETQPRSTGDQDESTSENQEQENILVNLLLMRYIITYHWEVFEELDNVSSVVIFETTSSSEKLLKAVIRKGVDEKSFQKAAENFIGFYQKLYPIMYQETIPVDQNSPPKSSPSEVISAARSKFMVIVSEETNQIVIYGPKEKTNEAARFINEKFKVSNEVNSIRSANEKIPSEKLSCCISNKVKLLVYQGDITEDDADAIVNPANENLQHVGGAALTISNRGGTSIQTESDGIMKGRKNRPLCPGDVEVTSSGNLPCNFVVHAVGPRSTNHREAECRKLLKKAVLNSLSIASENGAQTIAIPAISSGVFGVPVKICAEVLFTSVKEYVNGTNGPVRLTEIRFVNIDEPTVKVFVQEMKRRFGSSITNQNVVPKTQHPDQPPSGNTLLEIVREKNNDPLQSNKFEGNSTNEPREITTYSQAVSNSSKPQNGDFPIKRPPGSSEADSNNPKTTDSKDKTADDESSECSICLDSMTNPKTLDKCKHSFCTECIENAFKHQKKCPLCSEVYGVLTGNQPPGKMWSNASSSRLPGFKNCGTITIFYQFYDGTQGPDHPNPGRRYTGTYRQAYLPDNKEGQKVLKLLKKAFDQKLTFTIGRSSTTGKEDSVIWNDIHHKTNTYGGPTRYGYPDADYLGRVQEELAAKGIKE